MSAIGSGTMLSTPAVAAPPCAWGVGVYDGEPFSADERLEMALQCAAAA